MKIIKAILIIIVSVIVIITIVGLFAPSHVSVHRSIVINAPVEPIYDQVNNLKNWNNWSPWNKMDSAMKIEYSTTSEGAGASYTWSSNNKNVGNGELTITSSSKDSVCTAMNFMENGIGTATFKFEPAESGTKVTWSMQSDMGSNPFKKMFGYLMDKMLGPTFEHGLGDLKKIAESMPVEATKKYDIKEVELTEKVYIIKKDSVSWNSIQPFFSTHLPVLFSAIKKAKLKIAGAPAGLYFQWDEMNKSAIMAVAVPVIGNAKTKLTDYITLVIPAGKNLHITYMGGYSEIGGAHMEMDSYMKAHNLLQGIPIIEEYVAGPSQETDSSKWETNIYYPVK